MSYAIKQTNYNHQKEGGMPKGRKEFVMEQMLTPAMSVRINAKLDTVMGIVTWQFTAIDPVTKDIPVFEGFLPPNKAKPEGEGSGSYTVYPRQTIADGTVFLNRASIVFDFNLPVFTNTWENIADVPPPVSSVLATVTAGDSIIHLNFTGNDAKSGTGYYNLYVSENNGPWQAFGGGATDTLSLKGEPGKTYGFYSVANDKVGNLEEKLPAAETVVSLSNPLTINLGNISATNVGKRNRVNWNTLSEDIGDYFIAERSSNTMQFAPFNTVPAWGTASAYQVFDDTPVVGRNYYRLRLYRPDGSYKLSKVVSAIVSDPQTFIIKTFPNPLKDMLTIAIQGMIEGAATISVINAQGSTIQTINGVKNTTEVNMTTLAKGVYFIRYIDKNRSKVIKVFKN